MGCLRFDYNACSNLRNVHVTNESEGNRIKDVESFDIMFFIHLTKQNAGDHVRLTIKTT